MSYFGFNIKKIRKVKRISQNDFANIFGLSRAAVGSYEEGRAEAKIDKIIEIADYFNLSLDALLRRKLTVNEILNYKSPDEANIKSTGLYIPYVAASRLKTYIDNVGEILYLKSLPRIYVPDAEDGMVAFQIDDRTCFLDDEIIICSKYQGKKSPNDWYLLISESGIELSEKLTGRKKYFEVWLIRWVIMRSLYKVRTAKMFDEIKNKIDNFVDKINPE